MYTAKWKKYILTFKQPGGTSRGVLHEKETWFVELYDDKNPSAKGTGECNLFKGLSSDDIPGFENKLEETCNHINEILPDFHQQLIQYPSIRSGIEQAKINLESGQPHLYFRSDFTSGKKSISINGLIWMGSVDFMIQQIDEKIAEGYSCIKIKIGTLPEKKN